MSKIGQFFYNIFAKKQFDEIFVKLNNIIKQEERLKEIIMANQKEFVDRVKSTNKQIQSVGLQMKTAIAKLQEQLRDLEAQLQNGNDFSEAFAALDELQRSVQDADNLVDDLPGDIGEPAPDAGPVDATGRPDPNDTATGSADQPGEREPQQAATIVHREDEEAPLVAQNKNTAVKSGE